MDTDRHLVKGTHELPELPLAGGLGPDLQAVVIQPGHPLADRMDRRDDGVQEVPGIQIDPVSRDQDHLLFSVRRAGQPGAGGVITNRNVLGGNLLCLCDIFFTHI